VAFQRTAWILLVVSILLVHPAEVSATSFRTYGFGARAVAMGGAMTAHVADYTATFYNPAGLVTMPVMDLATGLQYANVKTEASNPAPVPPGWVRDSDAFPVDDAWSLYGGLRLNVPFAAELKDRVGFGLSFYTNATKVLDVRIPYGFKPQFVLLNGQTNMLVIQPGLGIRILDGLRVGAAADIFADVGGNLEIPTGVRGADGVDEARTVIDQEVQPIIRATAGLQVDGDLFSETISGFSFGFTWRDSFSIPLQIPVTVLLGPIPLNIDVTSSLLWTPMQMVFGLSYRTPSLVIASDVSWNRWSGYEPPTLELALDIAIPVVPIDLKDAVNPDPGTRDTWTPRVGAEWRFLDREAAALFLRGGYAYDPTPFPEQTGLTNFLDSNRHIFSAGVGVSLSHLPIIGDLGKNRIHLDLGLQFNHFENRIHRKGSVNPLFVEDGNPLGFPPVEDATGKPMADPAYPFIEGRAQAVVVMFTFRTTLGRADP
jgi:long-chain fatty acid transport protein